ncbi:sensor histidine kinase [Ochrovirga pacifica]|uniref:sensor histidine kinase n=1 Tax=Ochrovirga pacifica TaxID=1042376 RepID=UPI000525CD0F|nr:histidine kinase [Ochrovirga pacifica]
MKFTNTSASFSKELLFQCCLTGFVFVLYSFGRHDRIITLQELFFFSNHAIGAYFIGYVLLPKFYYTRKYLRFSLYSFLTLTWVVFVEEGIMERIYYPTTRGRNLAAQIYDVLDVLPTLSILLGAKFAWDAIIERKKTEQLELLAKKSELQFLKTQINPHFLFNNLNNLYALSIENSNKTPDFILELSDMLRYMLYDCKAQFVSLDKEIEHLQNFIKLNEMQIEGRGFVNFNLNVAQNNYQIAPLIFMVFIENAFKHSASSQTTNIHIDVNLSLNPDGRLIFTCVNSYLPKSNTQNLAKGIGLKNVKKRLELLYPSNYQLEIAKKTDNYWVNLQIQLAP